MLLYLLSTVCYNLTYYHILRSRLHPTQTFTPSVAVTRNSFLFFSTCIRINKHPRAITFSIFWSNVTAPTFFIFSSARDSSSSRRFHATPSSLLFVFVNENARFNLSRYNTRDARRQRRRRNNNNNNNQQ